MKREKRRKEDKWLRSGKECDHRKFKEARLEYIRSCNTAKTKYYTNEVLKCEGDQKKIYKLISNLTDGENIMMVKIPTQTVTVNLNSVKILISFLLKRLIRSCVT